MIGEMVAGLNINQSQKKRSLMGSINSKGKRNRLQISKNYNGILFYSMAETRAMKKNQSVNRSAKKSSDIF